MRDVTAALERMGYERVPMVTEVAQFSVRGGIVDVYGFGMAAPTRLEWWGDDIESIRAFDLTNQRSGDAIAAVTILPIRVEESRSESKRVGEGRREPKGARPPRADRPSARPPVRPSTDRPPVRPTIERPPVAPPAPRRTGKYGRPVWLTLRNTTLLLVPASVVLNMMHANPLLVFAVACLGVVPLAAHGERPNTCFAPDPPLAACSTLHSATRPSFIIAIVALRADSWARQGVHHGSILGNLLLIMGLCCGGGTGHAPLQPTSAGTSAGMLLAVVG